MVQVLTTFQCNHRRSNEDAAVTLISNLGFTLDAFTTDEILNMIEDAQIRIDRRLAVIGSKRIDDAVITMLVRLDG